MKWAEALKAAGPEKGPKQPGLLAIRDREIVYAILSRPLFRPTLACSTALSLKTSLRTAVLKTRYFVAFAWYLALSYGLIFSALLSRLIN